MSTSVFGREIEKVYYKLIEENKGKIYNSSIKRCLNSLLNRES
jgi:hypothetical protein